MGLILYNKSVALIQKSDKSTLKLSSEWGWGWRVIGSREVGVCHNNFAHSLREYLMLISYLFNEETNYGIYFIYVRKKYIK